MYNIATKNTRGDLIAKFGPPPWSLVGSPAELGQRIRGRPGPYWYHYKEEIELDAVASSALT